MKSFLTRQGLLIALIALVVTACNSGSKDTDLVHNPASDKPMTAEDSARMPIIAFDTLYHDFGKIKEGDVAEYEFKFTNKGKGGLIISDVKATCGCTTPYKPDDVIKPGASDAIKVAYDSDGRPGTFRKGVTVTSNTYPNTTKLTISGTVIPNEQ
jgi:hypothetical protein